MTSREKDARRRRKRARFLPRELHVRNPPEDEDVVAWALSHHLQAMLTSPLIMYRVSGTSTLHSVRLVFTTGNADARREGSVKRQRGVLRSAG